MPSIWDTFDAAPKDGSVWAEFDAKQPGEFRKGLSAGVDQLQAIGGGAVGLIGSAVGADRMRDWGLDVYQRNTAEAAENAPKVPDITEITSIGQAKDWLAYQVGNQVPILAGTLGAGGVGGLIGRKIAEKGIESGIRGAAASALERRAAELTASGVAEPLAARQAAQEVASEILAKGTQAGALAGAGAASYGIEAGSIFGDIKQETGQERPGVAAAFAAPAALLDVLPIGMVFKRLGIGEAAKEGVEQVLKRDGWASAIAKQAGAEGVTEGLQTIVERAAVQWVDENKKTFSPEGWKEIINAAAAGGVLGGVTGAAGKALEGSARSRSSAELVERLRAASAEEAARAREQATADAVTRIGQATTIDEAIAHAVAATSGVRAGRPELSPEPLFESDVAASPLGLPVGLDQAIPRAERAVREQPAYDQRAQAEEAAKQQDFNAMVDERRDVEAEAATQESLRAEREAAARPAVPPNDAMRIAFEKATLARMEALQKKPAAPAPSIDEAAHDAAASPKNERAEPTDGQKEAGNYKKGQVKLSGLAISVENPEGSTRSGVSPDGKPWSNMLRDHYGYIKGVPARAPDKEHVDVFIKPGTPENFAGDVYVVDQNNEKNRFDEPKVMIGYGSIGEAREGYLRNYAPGWKGLRNISPVPMGRFKEMLLDPDSFKKPQPFTAQYYLDEKNNRRRLEPGTQPPAGGKAFTDLQAVDAERRRRLVDTRRPDPGRDSLNAWIAKRGGLDISERLDTIGDDTNQAFNASQWLFRPAGEKIDELARRAVEDGYLTEAEAADVDGGVQALKDKIRDEFSGVRRHYSHRNTSVLDEQAKAGDEEEVLLAAGRFGIPTAGLELDDIRKAVRQRDETEAALQETEADREARLEREAIQADNLIPEEDHATDDFETDEQQGAGRGEGEARRGDEDFVAQPEGQYKAEVDAAAGEPASGDQGPAGERRQADEAGALNARRDDAGLNGEGVPQSSRAVSADGSPREAASEAWPASDKRLDRAVSPLSAGRDGAGADTRAVSRQDRSELELKPQTESDLREKEKQAVKGDVEASAPRTGTESEPLLTPPAGTAPARDVSEQKVPTQQGKLFEPGGDYLTDAEREVLGKLDAVKWRSTAVVGNFGVLRGLQRKGLVEAQPSYGVLGGNSMDWRLTTKPSAPEPSAQGKLFEPAPLYDLDEDGPRLVSDQVAIVQPSKWESRGDLTYYEHLILDLKAKKVVGNVTLGWRGDKVGQLLNIRVYGGNQTKGLGEAVIRTILEQNGDAELHVAFIASSAEGFWRKMGVRFIETDEGKDAVASLETYRAARPGKQGADAQPEGAARARADRAEEGGRAGGEAQGPVDRAEEVSAPGREDEGKKRAETPPEQFDLFAATPVPGTPAKVVEKFVVEPARRGTIKVAYDKIDTAEKAAHVFAGMRKEPRERFQMVGLDENYKPVAFFNLFAGTTTQTSVYPREVWTALYQTPGVRKVWISHNHPSGVPLPSRADELLTRTLEEGLSRDTGVEMLGHVIIAGKMAVEFAQGAQNRFPIPTAVRKIEVPILERTVRKWAQPGEGLTSPGAVRDALRKLDLKEAGLVFTDAQHRMLTWWPMSLQEMRKLRTGDIQTGFGKLVRQVGRVNAAAAIAYAPTGDQAAFRAAAANLGAALKGLDVKLLDAFTQDPHRPNVLVSFAEHGNLDINQTFFRRGRTGEGAGADAARRELVDAYGEKGIKALEDSGFLELTTSDDARLAPIIDQMEGSDAVYWKGKAWLLTDRMVPGQAPNRLLHELGEHHGLEGMLGKAGYEKLLARVDTMHKGGNAAVRDAWALVKEKYDFAEGSPEFVREVIAALTEDARVAKQTWWRELLDAIKAWLAKRGLGVKDEKDVLALLRASVRKVMRDAGEPVNLGAQPAFSKASDLKVAIRLPDGDIAVAKDGEATHGQIYDRLSRDGTIADAAPRVQYDTDVESGFVDRSGKFLTRDDAYDAVGVYGSEDLDEPEPMFSRPSIAASRTTGDYRDSLGAGAGSFVRDLLHSDSTFNWWHKTIGTQQHKALSNAAFKSVYDESQAFLADVSKYANEAADEAKSLLPRIDSFADFKKSSPSKADIDGATQALYAGTLWGGGSPLEGRIWTDEELRSGRARDGKLTVPAFKALTEPQIVLYRQALASISKSLDELGKSLIHRLARQHDIGFDRALNLEDVAATVRDTVDGMIDAKEDQIGTLQDPEIVRQMEDAAAASAGGTRAAENARRDVRRKVARQVEKIEREIAELETLKKGVSDIETKTAALKGNGYFPAMRFGQFAVHVVRDVKGSKTPEQLYFGLFESQTKANLAARELEREFPGARIERGIISKEQHRLFQGMSLDALETFADYITGEDGQPLSKNPLVQGFLKAAVSERSSLKRHIHRKGVAGYSDDLPRVLASFTVSSARTASSNYHTAEMLRLAGEIQAGDVKDEAIKLVRYLVDPQEEAQALRGFLFAQFLGGSIAHGLVNMTQPFMVTIPYLSQYTSAVDAAARISAAAVARPDKLTGKIRDAYQRAKSEGIVSPQEIHQLRAETGGLPIAKNLALRKLSFLWGSIYAVTEQFNRSTAFIAAYRIAEEKGMPDPYTFAANAVNETQFVYNKGNRPNWARGAIGATVFTFKQFSISYLELGKRIFARDRKAFALMALALLAGAGVQGLPFAEDLEDLIDTIGQWMGFATNSKKALRKWATEQLGPEMAQVVLHGVSGFSWMPVDVSVRLGLQNLIPGTAMLKLSEENKAKDVLELVGPVGQFVPTQDTMMGRALERLSKGDMMGAVKSGAPVAVQNVAKGAEMLSTGEARDTKGKKILDVTPAEAMLKMAGLQPSSVARASEKVGAVMQDINLQKRMESEIAEEWARAIVDGKPQDINDAVRKLTDWNRDNPELRIKITGEQIRSRVKAMRTTREERLVKSTPPEVRATVRSELR